MQDNLNNFIWKTDCHNKTPFYEKLFLIEVYILTKKWKNTVYCHFFYENIYYVFCLIQKNWNAKKFK